MNKHYVHDIIKRSEHVSSLFEYMRSELKIMNKHYVHDIIKRSEHVSSLLEYIRSERMTKENLLEGKANEMLVNTRHFGEIELDENKVIYFENGILGFEDYKKYTLLYDDEGGEKPDISWLQSLDEPSLAIPVVNPFIVRADYNPEVDDELLKPLGNITEENIVVLISITVPAEVEKISANLKAPFIINSDERKGAQIVVENSDYEVKYHFYEQLKAHKAAKEGK